MDRRNLITGVVAAGLAPATGAAAYDRPAGMAREAGVSRQAWGAIYAAQQESMWCWAASLQMLFASAGRRVSQARIVQESYGTLVNLPAFSARNIAALSNRYWTDDYGRPFSARLMAAYDYFAGVATLNNATVIQALGAERPMILCNRSHAMLLTAATYVPTPYGPNILNLGVFDPWPGRGARGPDRPGEFVAAHMGGELTYLGLAIIS